MKKMISAVIVLTLLSAHVKAQEAPITQLFKGYIKELNDLNKTKDLNRVLKFFDPSFETNQTYIGLSGVARRSTRDFSDFTADLQVLTTDRDVQLNLKIDKINDVVQGSRSGTISASLTMDILVDRKIAEKGSFNVTMAAAKAKAGSRWLFIHSDNIRTVEERNAGRCICYFYERKNDFVTELSYPVGFDYYKILDTFRFRNHNDVRTIHVDDRWYEWEKSGEILDLQGGAKTEVGTAQDPKGAAVVILGQIYQENCLSFTTR